MTAKEFLLAKVQVTQKSSTWHYRNLKVQVEHLRC